MFIQIIITLLLEVRTSFLKTLQMSIYFLSLFNLSLSSPATMGGACNSKRDKKHTRVVKGQQELSVKWMHFKTKLRKAYVKCVLQISIKQTDILTLLYFRKFLMSLCHHFFSWWSPFSSANEKKRNIFFCLIYCKYSDCWCLDIIPAILCLHVLWQIIFFMAHKNKQFSP